jgi:uncharacterized protein
LAQKNKNMLDILHAYHFTPFQWALVMLCAILIGITKSGLSAISIITVSIFAWLFGSKTSTGILLPMLIFADILAVFYYKRHANWQLLGRIAPWVMLGILAGVWIGKDLNEAIFKKMMASLVFVIVASLFWFEKRPLKNVPSAVWFSAIMGIATGFTTMVGNQAGGFANIYFLSMRLSKQDFIGSYAWLFLFMNVFKLPFHVFIWKTVQMNSLVINFILLPFVIFGFYLGVYVVARIEEARYRQVILWLTAGAAVCVLL